MTTDPAPEFTPAVLFCKKCGNTSTAIVIPLPDDPRFGKYLCRNCGRFLTFVNTPVPGEWRFPCGKFQGRTLQQTPTNYIEWSLRALGDMSARTRKAFEAELARRAKEVGK